MAPSAAPSASASAAPTGDIPTGWTEHDVAARDKVRRYLGNLVKALPAVYPAPVVLKLADILGVEDDYPELSQKPAFVQVPQLVLSDALTPLKPTMDGDVKVFNLTIDDIRAEDRRSDAAGRRASATTASGRARRSASTRATRSGRSSRTTSRRRPASTSTASSSTTSSRTASRS